MYAIYEFNADQDYMANETPSNEVHQILRALQ